MILSFDTASADTLSPIAGIEAWLRPPPVDAKWCLDKQMFGLLRKDALILDAVNDDFESIADLHSKSFARGWSVEEIDELARQDNVTILVAREVGKPKGAVLGFNIVRQAADEAEILSVGVDPGMRRNGLGEKLMREALLRLRADRINALLLEVDGNNPSALHLYEKLGFQVVGKRPAYYAPKVENESQERATALVMRLDLV